MGCRCVHMLSGLKLYANLTFLLQAYTMHLSSTGDLDRIHGILVTQLQRTLSTPARELRRRTASVAGTVTRSDGTTSPLTTAVILEPLERSLKVLCWLGVAMAVALAYLRLS